MKNITSIQLINIKYDKNVLCHVSLTVLVFLSSLNLDLWEIQVFQWGHIPEKIEKNLG